MGEKYYEMTDADVRLAQDMADIMWEAEERIADTEIGYLQPYVMIGNVIGMRVSMVDVKKTMILMKVFADEELKLKAEEAINRYLEADQ